MKDSHIQWTDHTFNPWEGCTKVSPGCANCYAEARNVRFTGGKNWGKGAPRRRTSASNWRQPLKWTKKPWICDACGAAHEDAPNRYRCDHCNGRIESTPSQIFPEESRLNTVHSLHKARVFCASLADWLDDEVRVEWLADLLKLIHDTPNLYWLLLTKRPEKWRTRLKAVCTSTARGTDVDNWATDWFEGKPPANVWIGTTVEDQQRADERIPELLKIPARVRFLSCEPLLEAVDLTRVGGFTDGKTIWTENAIHTAVNPQYQRIIPKLNGIDWVICGGESGGGARTFDVDWARSLLEQCKTAGVPFFMKQMGANVMGREMDKWVTRLSKKGGEMEEWPQELRVREFPTP